MIFKNLDIDQEQQMTIIVSCYKRMTDRLHHVVQSVTLAKSSVNMDLEIEKTLDKNI
jgi:hypothetical protein